jgi:hypothetical protein
MQATQGEEWGGQTPGGVRVGLDFFAYFLHQGKKYKKKFDTTGSACFFMPEVYCKWL